MTEMKKPSAFLILLLLILLPTQLFAARATFVPRTEVTSEYTDNVDLTPDNEDSEIITVTSAGFNAALEGKTAGITLDFLPGYAFYADESDNNSWRLNSTISAFAELTRRTRLDVSDRFFFTEDPNPDFIITEVRQGVEGVEVDPTLRRGRNQYWRNNATAELSHQFGREDSLNFGYTYSVLRNDSDFEEDIDEHVGFGGVTYYFDTRWGVDLNGSYTRGIYDPTDDFIGTPSDDYDEWAGTTRLLHRFNRTTTGFVQYSYSTFDFDGDEEDYDIHDGRLGVDYAIEEDLSLAASAGYYLQDNDFSDDENGFAADFSLRKSLRRGGYRLEAGAGYDNLLTTSETLGFTQYYRVGVTADYQLFRRVSGDIYGFYRYDDFTRTEDREDDLYRAGCGLTWTPVRWTSIRLAYAFNRRDSTEDINDYTENRVLLTINFSTEQPFRALY